MHTRSIENWTHEHVFLGEHHSRNERRTWFVVVLTSAMMVAEIVAGSFFGSMALLADGWHMAHTLPQSASLRLRIVLLEHMRMTLVSRLGPEKSAISRHLPVRSF